MRFPSRVFPILLLVAATASAAAKGIECRLPQKQMVVVDLLFGRNIGGRLGVSERRWSKFLAREVTPRLTVFDAAGQWLDPERKKVVREPSKIVRIIMRADAAGQHKLDLVVAAYKREFRQQSVGVVMQSACVAF